MPTQQAQQQQSQQHQHHQHAPLQEINQEDLTAILPTQEQEDAPFDGFEDSESGRLVSKAIERMSLSADSDMSENGDQNPVPVYSSTLLQQFVEKTAMLSEPRKRRSKCGKKSNNDSEYPCVSNVSPDSGIQSVDNSPLHLAISPVSPPVTTQSPIQPPIVTKPAVNVDRVLYPPKRKPGRPAKTVSTQPRGPGRPRLKPEVVEKIEKIEKAEKEKSESLKNLKNPDSRLADKKGTMKESTMKNVKEDASSLKKRNAKPVVSREEKVQAALPASKRMKGKPATHQKKRYESSMKASSQKKTMGTTSSQVRVKCLNRSSANKLVPQCDGRSCRKVRQDRSYVPNKTTVPLTRQKQSSCEHQISSDQKTSSVGKRTGSKENRNSATTTVSRKPNPAKKTAPPTTRRVLKENKCNRKTTAASFETNGVGVQTLISLPVGDILKAENMERVSNKCDKATQPAQRNHCHKRHHHHKHRRRLLAPPKDPIRANPCIIQDLESLVDQFMRLCSLGRNNTSASHSELPQIFRVKKVTKKRKGGDVSASDDQKLKRRLKKEKTLGADSKSSANTSTSSNPNEQRLPLKKRHYHVSSPHSSQSSNASCADANANESNSTESHIEEAIEATITRYGGGSSTSSIHDEEAVPVTPKKRPRDAENTPAEKQVSDEDKSAAQTEIQPRRKKKIVKDLRVTVTKLPSENHGASDKADKSEKSSKLAMEKSSKIEKLVTEKSIKADKTQSDEKVDAEHIRAEKAIKIDSDMHVSETMDDDDAAVEKKLTQVGNSSVPNLMSNNATMILTKKKVRKRKTINRTGFPTLKKKKKKKPVDLSGLTKSTVLPGVNGMCKGQDVSENAEDKKAISLIENQVQNVLAERNETREQARGDTKNVENSSTVRETSSRSGSDEVIESCPGQLRVRKDLVESDSSVLSEKLYSSPVKYEKIPDCRIYDENASLEVSLERYNQSQRIAELNEENLRKLERANAAVNVKMELSGCFNNNHKRRRGSTSPSNLYGRSAKRLRSAGYDTESEAPPSSDVASEDQELSSRKPAGPGHTRKKQSRWKKRYLQARGILFSEYKKDLESKKIVSVDGKKKIIVCGNAEHYAAEQLPGIIPTGKLLRQRKTPFQLQYDLLWLHSQSRLPGRDLVPSWNYK